MWTFSSAAPADPVLEEAIPLLVVDYELPLDTLNRPTRETARITVGRVTGSDDDRPTIVRRPRVFTSVDGGDTWDPVRVRTVGSRTERAFELELPSVDPGTNVSLRVEAQEPRGNRIEQTLFDAYTG